MEKEIPKLTKEQAVILSAYTGMACTDTFADVHEYIEKITGRPVFTHELAFPRVASEIREKAREDFLKIAYNSEANDGE